jgi:hypothetical protein
MVVLVLDGSKLVYILIRQEKQSTCVGGNRRRDMRPILMLEVVTWSCRTADKRAAMSKQEMRWNAGQGMPKRPCKMTQGDSERR